MSKDHRLQFDPNVTDEDRKQILALASKPQRVYIGTVLDGIGDFMNLVNRASANQRLPKEFRKAFPETYVIDVTTRGVLPSSDKLSESEVKKEQLEYVRQKKELAIEIMKGLPKDHPMHIDKLGKSVLFADEHDLEAFQEHPKIIYHVSTTEVTFTKKRMEHERDIAIFNREFSTPKTQASSFLSSLSERNMGFSILGHGIYVEESITMSDKEILEAFNQATPEEGKLLRRILNISEDRPITTKDLQAFRDSSDLLPVYTDKEHDKLLSTIKGGLLGSEILGDKKLVVLTNKGTEEESEECRVINKGGVFLTDKLYSALKSLASPELAVFSGDNTFQDTINSGKLPLGYNYKPRHIDDFKEFIRNSELDSDDSTRLLEYFTALEKGEIDPSLINHDLLESWKKLTQIIKAHFNYCDIVPKMELQSCALHQLMTSDLPDLKLLKFFSAEEKVCLLYELEKKSPTLPDGRRRAAMVLVNLNNTELSEMSSACEEMIGNTEGKILLLNTISKTIDQVIADKKNGKSNEEIEKNISSELERTAISTDFKMVRRPIARPLDTQRERSANDGKGNSSPSGGCCTPM